jgi:hypothetical protein
MMRTVKRLFSIFLSVLLVAACAGGSKKPMLSGTDADLQQRDAFLLQHGMIYYGHDQQPGAFADMYYAFVAGAKEMEAA